MTTEDTLDSSAQDSRDNPEHQDPSDSDAQPEDLRAALEAERTARETAERRYAELRKDYNEKARQSKSERSDEPPGPERAPEADTLWLIEHANELKLVRAEYEHYLSLGYQRDHALKLAKLDRGLSQPEPTTVSGAPSVTDRTDDLDVSDEERHEAEKWGFSVDVIKAHKELKRQRGQ